MNIDFPFSDSWFDDHITSNLSETDVIHQSCNDLELDMIALQQPIDFNDDENMEPTNLHLKRLLNIVNKRMGSMVLCRGANGDILREAGAVQGLLSILSPLSTKYDHPASQQELIIDLATASLGALRDLACGNSANRYAIGTQTPFNGTKIIAQFIQTYHLVPWDQLIDTSTDRSCYKKLRLITTAIAVIRNITHSNRVNCDELHNSGLTYLLIWRLLYGQRDDSQDRTKQPQRTLPDASVPWREACYRIAGSLVNMAEYNMDCAITCASDNALVEILLKSWDDHLLSDNDGVDNASTQKRRSTPLIHIGLLQILSQWEKLNVAHSNLAPVVQGVLVREQERKVAARIREQKSLRL